METIEKPKKPRSQAQKDAFEKARARRAENVAKKKEQAASATKQEGEHAPEAAPQPAPATTEIDPFKEASQPVMQIPRKQPRTDLVVEYREPPKTVKVSKPASKRKKTDAPSTMTYLEPEVISDDNDDIEALFASDDNSSDDDDDDEPVMVEPKPKPKSKRKAKPRQQRRVYESDSDSDVEVIKKRPSRSSVKDTSPAELSAYARMRARGF